MADARAITTCVLVPVKGFAQAKERLAAALSPPERARLARDLADRVVDASHPLPVAIVCDDHGVANWARARHTSIIWRRGVALNGAVTEARLALAHFDEIIVVHADLAQPAELAALAGFDGITLVPDHRGDGTNVIVVPRAAAFRFSYGPQSFARHLDVAQRSGLDVRVVHGSPLGHDIDNPEDLRLLAGTDAACA